MQDHRTPQLDLARWTLGGFARRYSWPQCRYCGRAQSHDCARVECLLCSSPQCFGNGSGNGRCSVCLHGYLPGWSRSYHPVDAHVCGYKGCDEPAVANARKRPVCASHAQRVKVSGGLTLAEHVSRTIEQRNGGKGWQRWTLMA